MIAVEPGEIKNCSNLKKVAYGRIQYCECYAYKKEIPCNEKIKNKCLQKYHKLY